MILTSLCSHRLVEMQFYSTDHLPLFSILKIQKYTSSVADNALNLEGEMLQQKIENRDFNLGHIGAQLLM